MDLLELATGRGSCSRLEAGGLDLVFLDSVKKKIIAAIDAKTKTRANNKSTLGLDDIKTWFADSASQVARLKDPNQKIPRLWYCSYQPMDTSSGQWPAGREESTLEAQIADTISRGTRFLDLKCLHDAAVEAKKKVTKKTAKKNKKKRKSAADGGNDDMDVDTDTAIEQEQEEKQGKSAGWGLLGPQTAHYGKRQTQRQRPINVQN
eukprot:TRINITY_DN9729_c0_g1_i1.p1 TRINITY_DN9729_c0_g1~~TRINITY_DN9729_c0_g1_i1.p1  ORF type:complete len:206 (-),score=34.31 TRINITY_DN9729_c0_g1_i1:122-739(-)